MDGRIPPPVALPSDRSDNFDEVVGSYNLQQAVAEASRCLFCYDAPCIKDCPAEVDIPTFIGRIRTQDLNGAIDLIRESNVFAGVCGRICPVEDLCEKNCVMNQMGGAIAIANLQRFAADFGIRKEIKHEKVRTKNKKVAIVGAGPAGLAAATELVKRGYTVEVFERRQSPGGLLRFGIPTYRLASEVSRAEIELIKNTGVKIHVNRPIKKIGELLENGFDAVFIGIGVCKCAPLQIPGIQLDGVYSGIEFLESMAKGQPPSMSGMKVGIIGGGDVAVDAARTAKRLGAETVYIIYRRSLNEMLASKEQLHQAKEEGVKIMLLTTPTSFLGENGQVKGCEFVRMKLGEPDETGRMRPIPINGSEFRLSLDAVVTAIGQVVEEEFLKQNRDIRVSKGLIVINDQNSLTSKPGIFAGGDVVSGGTTVVQAVKEGKRAARGIDKYLSGR